MTEEESRGLDRELVCVLFPGVVKNDEKGLQCLGGLKYISQVYSQPTKKRLGLSYQPDNPFVKKVYADNKKSAGVLLKVKVKKVKVNGEVQRNVVSTDVVGKVSRMYKFDSMCDFQFLPVHREETTGTQECLLEKILPSGLDNVSFLEEPCPFFVVPSNFTRSDKPIQYAYTDKRYPDRSGSPSNDDFHNKCRSERGMPLGHWWWYNATEKFPSEPLELYIKNRDMRYEYNSLLKNEFDIIQKLFQDRPIWSLNRIRYHTKVRIASLKTLAPCVAVLMKDGPWKSMWVRYGYDPRKEPYARMYQTVDFRLRHTAGIHSMVMTRDQIVHYKKADRVRQLKRKNRDEPLPSEEIREGAVFFRPGLVPTQRQIFYQLADVHLPEVQAILAEEPGPDAVCHEKYGWLPPKAIDICRDHIFRHTKETLLATHNTSLKFDDGMSSDDDVEFEDGDINEMDETTED